jgi:FdhD protein
VRVVEVVTSAGRPNDRSVEVPIEAPLAIRVNDRIVGHLMRLPGHDAELALGFCVSEGYISGLADVLGVEVCDAEAGQVTVRTAREQPSRKPLFLTSACVGPREASEIDLPEALPAEGPVVSAEVLLSLPAGMREGQEVRRAAGAVHAAAVFDSAGERVVVREDVGRHNAIDKVVGYCLHAGCPLERGLLLSTGRASSEMVLKAVAARIPIAASRSGPTSLGVELADRLGLTLIGYLRPGRMTVYAHPEKLGTGACPQSHSKR